MSNIIKLGIILFITAFLSSLALQDNGLVSMVWGEWIIETSVTFLLVVLAVAFIALYLLTRFWSALVLIPRHWRETRTIKRHAKAEQTLTKGMIALEYGDWKVAEKQLIKSANYSDVGLIHYLSAAKMAHNQNAIERRDHYLVLAKERFIDEHESIGLVEARLLKEKSPKKSLAILQSLYQKNNRNRAVLAEYANLLTELQLWSALAEILPQVKKVSALEKPQIQAIEIKLISAQISNAENGLQLEQIWQGLDSKQQLQSKILAEYIEQKIGWNLHKGLPQLIIKSVNKHWDDRLVYQYGRLNFNHPIDNLKIAEKWLKYHKDNPILQLSLGRIACQGQLWAIAQSHLKISLKLRPEVETFHALAKCYEEEGLDTKAALVYKQAVLELDKKH
jgi:HemY protein